MSLPATDADVPATRRRRRAWPAALGWALAGAACAGGLWAVAFTNSLGLLGDENLLPRPMLPKPPELAFVSGALGAAGAVCGLAAGLFVGLSRWWVVRWKSVRDAAALGVLCGSTGGALAVPAAVVLRRWLHPVAGSALLWALVGALVALLAFALSREDARAENRQNPARGLRVRSALLWGAAGAACAGGVWAVALAAAQFLLGDSFFIHASTDGAVVRALLHAAFGGLYGLIAGAAVGFVRGRGRRASAALALGFDGATFGASGGALSVLAVVAAHSRLHPLASSSLAWAAVGFVAALGAYFWSHSRARRVGAADEDEDAEQPADAMVEWVLRGRRKPGRWRERAWFRVLPVLLASAWALVGAAAFAPSELSLGLLTAGVLGLAVALVLYNQECRLQRLERRISPPSE